MSQVNPVASALAAAAAAAPLAAMNRPASLCCCLQMALQQGGAAGLHCAATWPVLDGSTAAQAQAACTGAGTWGGGAGCWGRAHTGAACAR